MSLKYLITGTGRCGTVYMARFLSHMNIPCGHEAIFNTKGIEYAKKVLNGENKAKTSICSLEENGEWFNPNVIAESSYMAAPFLDYPILKDTKVVHLLRNPMKVLSSWVLDIEFFAEHSPKELFHYKKFILSYVPQIKHEKTEIEKACRYLLEWNKMIKESRKDKITVKIEDWPYQNMLSYFEINETKIMENNKINSWKKDDRILTEKDIPEGETKEEFMDFIKFHNYSP